MKLTFFNFTVYAMDGVYAETAGASFCEINILHHFYALKSRIQVIFWAKKMKAQQIHQRHCISLQSFTCPDPAL